MPGTSLTLAWVRTHLSPIILALVGAAANLLSSKLYTADLPTTVVIDI